jgi:hypothetical protein
LVRIFEVDMPAGLSGQTDGVDIWISNKLNATQRRCTIAHELVHIEQGHTKAQPEHIEMQVRYETARRLLPSELAGSCVGSTVREVADNFGVTPRVLMDRMAMATSDEVERAGCADCQLCPAAKFRFSKQPVGI